MRKEPSRDDKPKLKSEEPFYSCNWTWPLY